MIYSNSKFSWYNQFFINHDQLNLQGKSRKYYFRNHFSRTTVSLGDHNLKVFNEAQSVFRKISKIVRFPSYDQNLIDGDIALLHLSAPVSLSSNIMTKIVQEKFKNMDSVRYNQHCLFACRRWGEVWVQFSSNIRLGIHREDKDYEAKTNDKWCSQGSWCLHSTSRSMYQILSLPYFRQGFLGQTLKRL